jgi:cysteine desulfurase / selenocysteine lyase
MVFGVAGRDLTAKQLGMSFDESAVAGFRAETPGCSPSTNRPAPVHFNNAGSALPTQRTLDTVVNHLQREAAMGGYEAANAVAEELANVRRSGAALLNGSADEIAITASDTAGWVKVFWGFAFGGGFETRKRVVIDRVFYNSHYLSLLQAQKMFDLDIVVAPTDETGRVGVRRLGALLDDTCALVSLTMAPTHSGLVNPVEEVGALTQAAGIPYFVDGCQAVGQLPIDVRAIQCDALTGTGRKWLRGPRGTGILYVRRSFQERCDPPGIDGVSALWESESKYTLAPGATRFEEFEVNYAAHLGLGAAIDQALALGIENIRERINGLATHLRTALAQRPLVTVQDGPGICSGIVTFTIDGVAPAEVVSSASLAGININASSAAWARLDLGARGLNEVVRAAPHIYNTADEIDQLLSIVDRFL